MKKLLVLTAVFFSLAAFGQKPSLDHSVYDNWKTVSAPVILNDGSWSYYQVTPQEGDRVLYVYNLATGTKYSIDRGASPQFNNAGTKLVCKIAPLFQETRQAKIDKVKSDEMPKDTLAILDLVTGHVEKYPTLTSFKAASKMGNFIAFQCTPVKDKADTTDFKPAPKDNLYVLNLSTFAIDTIKSVDKYYFPKFSDNLVYVTKPEKEDSVTLRGVYLYEPATKSTTAMLTGEKGSNFGSVYFNEAGDKIAFYANLDTTKDAKKYTNIYVYDNGLNKVVPQDVKGLKDGWKVSDNASISFRGNDSYLTFGTCPIPKEKDTTLVDFEQPTLDIWVWNEDYLQTRQLNRVESEKKRTYLAKIDLDGSNFVQLADQEIPSVYIPEDNVLNYVVVSTDKPYRIQQQWSTDAHSDIYKISLIDGSRELLFEDSHFSSSSQSSDGKYVVAFDEVKQAWFQLDVATGVLKDVTSGLGVNFYDEEDDHPAYPGPYSGVTWGNDNKTYFIRDMYDIWQFDATGAKAPTMLTEGKGRANHIVYDLTMPYYDQVKGLLRNNDLLLGKPIYMTTLNKITKQTGFAVKDLSKKKSKLQTLIEGPYTYQAMAISNSAKGTKYLYARGNYETGNNLWQSWDNFKTQAQITDINPQQRDYNWGTVELVNWTIEDGSKAEGLLFKPENFDPNKKYPVMIYFYERYSDDLYAVRNPAPSASTVNIPYFVSNEYIVFIPDIWYTDGHPGKSCLKYLLPACDMLCEYPWVDGDNMAIQGQSWGGYQVAYAITQTGRFKAAGAGAPVSNMTSAYGGIRWESGIVRTLQYEDGQSRIGKDLWEGFDLYVENSPLFFVPNVTTPVLIMHNDSDGAVPWWQGIEFFTALKRNGKQAWMLQYNNEQHNLAERRNRKDLSIRLSQFFDHFLKGAPMPNWMKYGVPATEKGVDYGYGYDE